MKKLIQIYPWINNEEKKEVEKVVGDNETIDNLKLANNNITFVFLLDRRMILFPRLFRLQIV